MDAFGYLIGSWSKPQDVPKPGRPMQVDLPQVDLPPNATQEQIDAANAAAHQQLIDLGLIVQKDDGTWDYTGLMNAMAFNTNLTHENEAEKKAYNEAVLDAIDNQLIEERTTALAQSRSISEQKMNIAKSQQESTQRTKSIEKALIARMANQWAANRANENKTAAKVKKEGSRSG